MSQAIAIAAQHIVEGGASGTVGVVVDSISFQGGSGGRDDSLLDSLSAIWMSRFDAADIVAERYGLSRKYQVAQSPCSQGLMAAALQAGKFKDEVIAVATRMRVVDKLTMADSFAGVVVDRDECNRFDTTLKGMAKLKQEKSPGKSVTTGNASQLADAAAALVLMEAKNAEKRGLRPLGACKDWAVAGCEFDEMGIGPVHAVPRLLQSHALAAGDIDLWALNEAFASQCLYCLDKLGIDPASTTSTAAASPSVTPSA